MEQMDNKKTKKVTNNFGPFFVTAFDCKICSGSISFDMSNPKYYTCLKCFKMYQIHNHRMELLYTNSEVLHPDEETNKLNIEVTL